MRQNQQWSCASRSVSSERVGREFICGFSGQIIQFNLNKFMKDDFRLRESLIRVASLLQLCCSNSSNWIRWQDHGRPMMMKRNRTRLARSTDWLTAAATATINLIDWVKAENFNLLSNNEKWTNEWDWGEAKGRSWAKFSRCSPEIWFVRAKGARRHLRRRLFKLKDWWLLTLAQRFVYIEASHCYCCHYYYCYCCCYCRRR